MKTLNEQIEEILKGQSSRTSKRIALAKLGLLDSDVEIIMGNLPKPERNARFAYTFGVEIECINVDRTLMHNAARNRKLVIAYEGYNHNDNATYYKFVTDGSICGSNAIECVSPVLTCKDGFASLKACCEALNDVGASVNKSTGLHVHIATPKMTDLWYANVFKNYQKLEAVIDTFMAPSRRGDENCYCHTLEDHDFEECDSVRGVQCELGYDRYHKVNAEAYDRHKTIEFRQHQGTTNYEKINNWVRFCAKLVGWSKNHVLYEAVASIDEIPFLNKSEKRYYNRRATELAR